MEKSQRLRWFAWLTWLITAGTLALLAEAFADNANPPNLAGDFSKNIRPLVKQYCLSCHSTKKKKGDLDLERFTSLGEVRKDVRAWQHVLEMLEAGEMPPKKSPQPRPNERRRLLGWVRGFLDAEARHRAGDPGRVIVRRLSNAEYSNTVRDLTGINLQPARDFPADGAAGEGFTNAGDALVMSPTLLLRYMKAAKETAAHAVFLPDGLRFSPAKTRRDWTNEVLAQLHFFYEQYSGEAKPAAPVTVSYSGSEFYRQRYWDGKLPLRPYVTAAIRHRQELSRAKVSLEALARREHLNPKYFQILWRVLNDNNPSFPLDSIRTRWRQARPQDVDAVLADISAWQAALWRFVKIGSYRYGDILRQLANQPAVVQKQALKLAIKPMPGQKEVVLYLAAREFPAMREPGHVVWHRPRFEGKGKTLLLRDYLAGSPEARREGIGQELSRFGRHPLGKPVAAASLVAATTSVLVVRLPADLFRDRSFVVEGTLDDGADRVVQFQVLTAPPRLEGPPDAKAPWVAPAQNAVLKQLLAGFDDFRRVFPAYVCYGRIVPDDEIVCLKLFHREDEPLVRLFLDDQAKKRLDRLWNELRFISRWPVTENDQLPQFIGYVTQDQPKELLAYFESQRGPFRAKAEQFLKEVDAAASRQLQAVIDFAGPAYRQPLEEREKTELHQLYNTLRKKKMSQEEALRTVLIRVLISPSFLFRIERAAPGAEARPVSDWELATRLSYFLWASMPDAELRKVAGEGRLPDPGVLSAQVRRMLHDPKVRGLAVEFGTQWLHVRDIRNHKEKNEKLFPTFNDDLRNDLFEESARFFQELFQNDRPLRDILDANYTFLNDRLARHYGIPGITGTQWRKVDGVKKFGRGGILALGSVLTTQAGASRTSPVLRGNWLVETLLGEKLPKPPPNVPRLPEEETTAGLSVRQLVERHARDARCAVCHQRIDPYGFALENYDPIGRLRSKDLGGRPIDVKARLKDGTTFEGIDGLRSYLLNQRGREVERHFCQKLLGYALGRAVTLSDQPLLDNMQAALRKDGQRLSAAVLAIVQSRQFRYHRGVEATKEE